jgi:sialic acid synthase SpsE
MDKISKIGKESETYFIADIAANHDGDLERAKLLIRLAAEAGADAAKFQHFSAPTIVSEQGFNELGDKLAHQSSWSKSVFQVYEEASLPRAWTEELIEECRKHEIEFFTSPYSLELIDYVAPYVSVFKIGSGEITWIEAIERMCSYGKPILLATGASDIKDVDRALEAIYKYDVKVILMQCNTNYTADESNIKYLNLNVLKTFSERYPNAILGLSDHTSTHISVLGSVAMGARVIEKHFTDDCERVGPDHKFSLNPSMWREMVKQTRDLEAALGSGTKKIEANEEKSVIVQRRALRYASALGKGAEVRREDLIPLRPAPLGGIEPFRIHEFIGKILDVDVQADQMLQSAHFKRCE